MSPPIVIGPSKALTLKREETREWSARYLEPAISSSIEFISIQRPKEDDMLPVLIDFLRSKAAGAPLEPDMSKCRQPPLPAERMQVVMEFLSPILAEMAKEMPEPAEVLPSIVAKAEAACKRRGIDLPAAPAAAAAPAAE